ncbi:hypothetical protein GCM10009799_41610 [Nocardiopsis rhodophaea]|uniref:DUF1772 domain-containing protein n=1 Tax=Nocardiopsis rhodophaea TaxID=280238 RepID=A0ABP5EZJ8_9ACTN
MIEALISISSLASAMAAGALLVGLIVILPLLMSLSSERYPGTNAFVLHRMDKLMPTCTGIAILSGAALALLLDTPPVQAMYGLGAVSLGGVFAVSLGALGPLNTAIAAIDTRAPRPDWERMRMRWRTWHFIRVGCGQVGAILYAVALGIFL